MMKYRCGSCRWRGKFAGTVEGHDKQDPPGGTTIYTCHLNPPNGYWDKVTLVHELYWCSHHEERNPYGEPNADRQHEDVDGT